jgi:hypothetical protein
VPNVQFNYPQWQAFNALKPRRSVFYGWGRGVGKSWFTRAAWWLLISEWENKLRPGARNGLRGVRINLLMPTLKQAKDVHLEGVENELGGEWAHLRPTRIDRQSFQVDFPGGSHIKVFPASSYNSRTARGMRCDVLVCDEVDDIDAGVYDGVAVPWLSEPWSLGIELLGGTPTKGRHGLWYRMRETGRLGEKIRSGEIGRADVLETPVAKATREVFAELPAANWPAHLPQDPDEATLEVLRGFYGFHATYRDSPETVGPLAVARAKATTPEATFKREWEADPDAGEGLVYPFDETFHVREPPPERTLREFLVGMDHGWVDPAVLLRGGVQGHGEDAVLWLLDEHYESEVPNHIWNERAAMWRDAKFWPDPSRPDRISDLRSMGLAVGETDNDILAGIARVANLLFIRQSESGERWARLYVSPKCRNTIREFGLYRRKKLPDGSFDEMPEDKNNHAMDSCRYMAVGRFGRAQNTRHVTSGR